MSQKQQHQQQQQAGPSDMHVVTENGEQCFMWRSKQLTYIGQDRQELPQVLAAKFGPLATKLDLSYNSLTSFRNISLFTNLSELILDNNLLDDCQLEEFKQNLRLKTLSLNKNKFVDLCKLVGAIKVCFPNLEFLSLIGNPLWPSLQTSDPDPQDGAPIIANCSNGNGIGDHTPHAAVHLSRQAREPATMTSRAPKLATARAVVVHPARAVDDDEQRTKFAYQRYRYFVIYHLPNLRFLDSSPITGQERDEALRRCFWMNETTLGGRSLAAPNTPTTIVPPNTRLSNNDSARLNNTSNSTQPAAGGQFQLTIMSDFDHDNDDNTYGQRRAGQQPKGAFTRLSYRYTGKNSEGNRFIGNNDL